MACGKCVLGREHRSKGGHLTLPGFPKRGIPPPLRRHSDLWAGPHKDNRIQGGVTLYWLAGVMRGGLPMTMHTGCGHWNWPVGPQHDWLMNSAGFCRIDSCNCPDSDGLVSS